MVNVIAAIVGSVAFGIGAIAMFAAGMIRNGGATQLLSWNFQLLNLLILSAGWGSIALRQPFTDRPDDDAGTKSVLWAVPLMWTATVGLISYVLTSRLFRDLGARLTAPMLLAASMFALFLGAYLDDFDLWFWFLWSAILWVFGGIALVFSDNLDNMAAAALGKPHDSIRFKGLAWRLILVLLLIPLHHLLWALDVPAGHVITSYTISIILDVILAIAMCVYGFLVWWFVKPAVYDSSAGLGTAPNEPEDYEQVTTNPVIGSNVQGTRSASPNGSSLNKRNNGYTGSTTKTNNAWNV